jgi:CubicO group peptidase (beta-lactamase class C family)
MVEAASGKKLGAYFAEHLFDPLGMSSTAFKIGADMRRRLAKTHQRGEDGRLVPIERETNQNPEFEGGGGALYSTVQDYLKFVRMILKGGVTDSGKRLLKAETVATMGQNHMGANRVRMLKTVNPALSNDAEFFPGMPKTWGLTFQITTERAPTGRFPGSLSWAGLTNTYFWIDPLKGLGGVYLTQMLPFADVKSLPLFYAFEQAVYQAAG